MNLAAKKHQSSLFDEKSPQSEGFRYGRDVNKSGTSWQRITMTVEPRSAYLLQGPARGGWEHSIPGVDELRYSITFRNLGKRSQAA